MKSKLNTIIGLMLIFYTTITYAQHFRYQRTLKADSAGWNAIHLPSQLEARCRPDFADLRILAIKKSGDTVEAAYVVKDPGNQVSGHKIPLKILNRSKNDEGYFYTFEIKGNYNLEEIELDFELADFDFRITLEGSHNQQEWFNLLHDYRILSIHNQATEYSFTKLVFPEASYPFFRLKIPSGKDPGLVSANIIQNGLPKWILENIKPFSRSSGINKQLKQTIFNVQFEDILPVSFLQVHTANQGDFLRTATLYQKIKNPVASMESDSSYSPCGNFVLSSLGKNSFYMPKMLTHELKLVVENKDNEPLRIDSISVKTILQELWVRLPEAESYMIVYGNPEALRPQYDAPQILEQTKPVPHTSAIIGEELALTQTTKPDQAKWFEKDIYLYALMIVIIALLGYFSITMMRKKQ